MASALLTGERQDNHNVKFIMSRYLCDITQQAVFALTHVFRE